MVQSFWRFRLRTQRRNHPIGHILSPEDTCNSLVEGIRNGTASIVSDRSFEQNSSIGQAETSTVILAPSTTSQPKHWAKREILVTSPEESQSAYSSELAGVIAGLTIVDILVHHHHIATDGWTYCCVPLLLYELGRNHTLRHDWYKRCIERIQTECFITLSGIHLRGKFMAYLGDGIQGIRQAVGQI